MNTQSNEMPDSRLEPKPATPAVMAATRPFYWSLRRELWEYRSIYIAPLVVAGISLFGFMVVTMGRALSTRDLARRLSILEEPYHFSTAAIMGVAFVLGLF
jgi:ABC-2 type transport system permease protein